MKSKIAEATGLRYPPVAIILTNDRPEGALQFKEGRWGCVGAMFMAAARGRTAVFDRKTFGCLGGGVGLGFGNQYVHFPGGIEYFISTGNKEFFKTCSSHMRTSAALEEGEGYFKSPEIAKKFVDALPMTDVPTEYVVFKPLDQMGEEEKPEIIVFLANADQLSALAVLANYDRGAGQSVIVPFGAGCHTLFIIPYNEARSEQPRAVIGLTDISVRKHIDKDLLSFAVPYKMFRQMEANVEGSFLQKETWLKVLERSR
ncbi:hypothetical protein GFC01_01630 [Desulfofundulus thermobenzoicus]|uniref:DUF169 domain-containing protein n=1 Tax=Desulfofundulus thermobenzoicus TaxID=29376 RepID=A0A6N7IN06_9FIRM|nr:DUF169 domain-containing protein [Desulfofundulus thermobenzoicus]MQL50989.1 hypothetical protein [Desulfofundulus thermobenzoicus]HHW43474.1 DUF169 domain-containing protein [Desulfotomaculum sp.]